MARHVALLKKLLLVLSLLVLLWLLIAWQLLPRLLQSQAEAYMAGHGHSLRMQRPRFDPLRLRLELNGVELRDARAGASPPLLQFERLVLDVSAASLWRRALVLDDLELVAPQARFTLLAGGKNNWSPLLESFPEDDEPPSATLPRLEIRHFRLQHGTLDFADEPIRFATQLTPIDLELNELSTLSDGTGRYHLSARTALGAQLEWRGQALVKQVQQVVHETHEAGSRDGSGTPQAPASRQAAQGLQVSGELVLSGLDLARLTPMLAALRPGLDLAGELGGRFNYRADYSAGQFDLSLSELASELKALQLHDGQTGLGLKLGVVTLENGQYQLATKRFSLERLSLKDDRLTLERQGDKDALSLLQLAELSAEQLSLDMSSRQVELAALRARGGRLAARRDAQGRIDVQQALEELGRRLAASPAGTSGIQKTQPTQPTQALAIAPTDAVATRETRAGAGIEAASDMALAVTATSAAVTEAQPASAPWRYHIARFELADVAADWLDQSVQPAARLGLRDLGVVLQDVSADLQQPLPLTLHAGMASGGRLEVAGSLVPATAELQAEVKLSDLALAAAQPYLSQFLKLQIASGSLSLDGRAQYADGKPQFKGGFSLRRLRLDESENRQLLLALQLLSTRDLVVDERQVAIGALLLDGLDTKLHIDKHKSLNLSRLLRDGAAPAAVAPRKAAAGTQDRPAASGSKPAASAGRVQKDALAASTPGKAVPPFVASIERLRLRASALDFSDASLALPFGTRIHKLRGVINGLSTRPGRRASLELEGQVDEYGQARAAGKLDLSDPTGYSDIKVSFRNVAMHSLTPYAATFAGRRIDSGKLSLNLDYKITQRQLSGDNQVVIDQLVLGERVASPEARDLPLDLALALLQDGDGRIDLGLPVSGSLDDPQFSIGGLVWKVITNVITKLVTAPFRALGALFGGGESLEDIVFDAGSGRLNPPQLEKLRQLAGALQKRPALQLQLSGVWSPADRLALQQRDTRVLIAQLAGLQEARDTRDPGPLATTSPQVQQALEKLHAERLGKERLAALKAGFRRANPGQLTPSVSERLLSGLGKLMHQPEVLDEQTQARLAGADFHALLFAELSARMSITDERLQDLARRRAQAVQQGLVDAGIGPERLPVTAGRQVEAREGEVPMAMELRPAPAAALPGATEVRAAKE